MYLFFGMEFCLEQIMRVLLYGSCTKEFLIVICPFRSNYLLDELSPRRLLLGYDGVLRSSIILNFTVLHFDNKILQIQRGVLLITVDYLHQLRMELNSLRDSIIILISFIMYSLKLAQKKEKQQHLKKKQDKSQRNWLKKYHSEVKPKLLERYDARVNAFIRQVEEAPEDKSKIINHHQSAHFRPFKFNNASSRVLSSTKEKLNISMADMTSGIRRQSEYVPLGNFQYRQREKEKELKPKVQLKILKYRKWQKESHLIGNLNIKSKDDGQISRLSAREMFFRRAPDDNRSEIPSMYDDNQSLRFSVNDNIEGEAREYEKNQELIERKQHFKRLANLEQAVKDPRAKKSIHELLVKGGFTKPKIKPENEQTEVDLLKIEMEKQVNL